MATRLETLNCGVLENCGIIHGDSDFIRIGDLPALPIDQFAEFSTEALLQMLGSNDVLPEEKERIKIEAAYSCGRVLQARIQDFNNRLSRRNDPLAERAKTAGNHFASQIGNPGRMYEKNPFQLFPDKVTISHLYDLSHIEFATFATSIIAGGMFGWGFGVPEAVVNNAEKLKAGLLSS